MNRSITEAEFLRSKDARRLTNPQKKKHIHKLWSHFRILLLNDFDFVYDIILKKKPTQYHQIILEKSLCRRDKANINASCL